MAKSGAQRERSQSIRPDVSIEIRSSSLHLLTSSRTSNLSGLLSRRTAQSVRHADRSLLPFASKIVGNHRFSSSMHDRSSRRRRRLQFRSAERGKKRRSEGKIVDTIEFSTSLSRSVVRACSTEIHERIRNDERWQIGTIVDAFSPHQSELVDAETERKLSGENSRTR